MLRYLKGSPSFGVFYSSSCNFELRAYSDTDWVPAGCVDTRRSLIGYCVFLVVAFSRELIWLSYLLHDLQVPVKLPISLFCDNLAALHITKNSVFHERTKHIDMDCHIVRERYVFGFLHPLGVSSSLQLADFFTKALASSSVH